MSRCVMTPANTTAFTAGLKSRWRNMTPTRLTSHYSTNTATKIFTTWWLIWRLSNEVFYRLGIGAAPTDGCAWRRSGEWARYFHPDPSNSGRVAYLQWRLLRPAFQQPGED